MADPRRWAQRAVRFAELYVEPAQGNYDPARRIIGRPHNGSDSTASACSTGRITPAIDGEEKLRLPARLAGPGRRPRAGTRPGPAAHHRDERPDGRGDTAVNLAAAGLVLNAWILTGDLRYRGWIEQYVGGWRSALLRNDGILPRQRRPGRSGRQPARRALVRWPLRLVMAARVVQRGLLPPPSPRWPPPR